MTGPRRSPRARAVAGVLWERLPTILALFVVTAVVIQAGLFVAREARAVTLRLDSPDEWMSYEAVTFERTLSDGLAMVSVSTVHHDLDGVIWIDNLFCETDSATVGFALWSSQRVERGQYRARPVEAVEWVYAAPHPRDGRVCQIRSIAILERSGIVKRLLVESDPFTP